MRFRNCIRIKLFVLQSITSELILTTKPPKIFFLIVFFLIKISLKFDCPKISGNFSLKTFREESSQELLEITSSII